MTSCRVPALAIFLLLAPLLRAQAVLGTLQGSVPFDNVGMHVAMLGDVNGDGRDDLAVGGGGGGSEPGEVRILSGPDLAVLHVLTGAHANDKASVVARLGDLNGDGASELAVGAWGDDTAGSESGSVTIYSGATGAVLHTLNGQQSSARFGWAVASAGDADGDGLDDVLVGAPGNGIPAHVSLYSSATWSLLLDLPGDGNTLGLGNNVASIQDLDGDGRRDILVGFEDSNRVRVYSSADGTALLQIDGPPGDFGRTVASVGDVDEDGVEDIAAGAPEFDSAGLPTSGGDAGVVQVHSSVSGALIFARVGPAGGVQMGREVAAAGDVDGDGSPDVLASAPYQTWNNPAEPGGVIVALSRADSDVLSTLGSVAGSTGLGFSLAGGGDLNGDGHPDLAAGSPNDDIPVQDAGRLTCASFRFRVFDAYPDRLLFSQPGNVSLFGGGFESGSPIAVTLGGQPATNVAWHSDGLVTFDAPIGTQDTQADLVYTQAGLSVMVPQAFTYEGVRLIETTPDKSPLPGGLPVTLWGEHFVDDGSCTVTFISALATITNIDAPNRIDVLTPVYSPPGPDIQLAGSSGSFTYSGFVYQSKLCEPQRGNIAGGLPVTLFGVPGHQLQNITVTMGSGGPACQVVSVTGNQIKIITPPVPEPTGVKSDVVILDSVTGTESLSQMFLYTPSFEATYDKNGFHGGTLNLRWVTDPAVPGTQLLTVWMGNPLSTAPYLEKALPGYAGLLRQLPWAFIFIGFPEPGQPQVMHLHVPPLDSSLSGLHLRFQSLVSGEGGTKGTFTNVDEVMLP